MFLRSFIKDDWDFIRNIPPSVNFECDLFSVDIVSLYTNIPHSLGVEAISYYFDKYRDKIPRRFTKEFMIESTLFILNNNNFFFDEVCYHQKEGTAMGTKFAPPYACLSVGYLEETKLYVQLPWHFADSTCELIIRWFLRYIDDGFILWPRDLDIDTFFTILNNLNTNIQYTIEASTKYITNECHIQELPLLDVLVILRDHKHFSTDIFYKETNSHFYLDYNSHHPQHIKDNIPYGLAKKIIVFVSDDEKIQFRLQQMKSWLLRCNYPLKIINKCFHNAKLQGPAPEPRKNIKNKLIFTSKFISNFSHENTVRQIDNILKFTKSERINNIFNDCNTMIAYKQPHNILRHVTKAAFTSIPPTISDQPQNGLFRCKRPNCKLCSLYIQECASFITANGYEWEIRCHIDCHSVNVLYYLKCLSCPDPLNPVTYTGKTYVIRDRMNVHISSCRLGGSSDKFDNHVFQCRQKYENSREPYFHIYAFFTVKNKESLETYENFLHKKGFDTMNRPK